MSQSFPIDVKKNKLKCAGDLEGLKSFIPDLKGKWKSPRGGTWQFLSEHLTVTWYMTSKTILFQGPHGSEGYNTLGAAILRVCELRVCELRVCKLRVCELRVYVQCLIRQSSSYLAQYKTWTGVYWTVELDNWTGQLGWTVGLDYWTGFPMGFFSIK